MLYDPRKSNFSRIERESGVKFERISAPEPADIAKAAGAEAIEKISEISDSVVPVFQAAAEELLNSSDLSATDLLAKAQRRLDLSSLKVRSLLPSMENHVTLHLECGRPIYSPSIKGLALTADGKGAVFDVSNEDLDLFLSVGSGENIAKSTRKRTSVKRKIWWRWRRSWDVEEAAEEEEAEAAMGDGEVYLQLLRMADPNFVVDDEE